METEEIQSKKGFNLRLEPRLKNFSLVEARVTLGITAKAVADEIGLNSKTYLAYEAMRRYPNIETQTRICQYFTSKGVSLIRDKVFPEELRSITPMIREFVVEREIPMGLFPYSQARKRLLPVISSRIEENLVHQELIRDISSVLSMLPYRQEQILRASFGIGTGEKSTSQLSQEYSISEQRVRQIIRGALIKLRRPPFRKILTPHLENSTLRELFLD